MLSMMLQERNCPICISSALSASLIENCHLTAIHLGGGRRRDGWGLASSSGTGSEASGRLREETGGLALGPGL